MQAAVAQARVAAAAGEVPVGAVVVRDGIIIADGCNQPVRQHDPTAHAEIVALRKAAQRMGNYRLTDCELFVTLEPCVMCAGAVLHARLKRVVYGVADPKTGAAGSVVDVFTNKSLNHQTQVAAGILQAQCTALLHDFFANQRRLHAAQKRASGALREDALRTPESRFAAFALPSDATFYIHDLVALKGLRMHYIDTGPLDTDTASLYLHGGSDWSYAWHKKMQQSARRVICPDLIGFGKSDKLKKVNAYSLHWHAQCIAQLIERLRLRHVELFAPLQSIALAQCVMTLSQGRVTQVTIQQPDTLAPDALEAPFPDEGHRAGLRAFSATVGHP